MKFITFILALVLLGGSISPCFDNSYDSESNEAIVMASSDNSQQDSEADNCSPFCMCSCCVSSADGHWLVYDFHVPYIVSSDIQANNQSPIINAGISFWQPPKSS